MNVPAAPFQSASLYVGDLNNEVSSNSFTLLIRSFDYFSFKSYSNLITGMILLIMIIHPISHPYTIQKYLT